MHGTPSTALKKKCLACFHPLQALLLPNHCSLLFGASSRSLRTDCHCQVRGLEKGDLGKSSGESSRRLSNQATIDWTYYGLYVNAARWQAGFLPFSCSKCSNQATEGQLVRCSSSGTTQFYVKPKMPTRDAHLHFEKWAREYGDIYSLMLETQTMIVLSSDEAVKELLDRNSGNFSNRLEMYVGQVLM
ncbi:unnamed protein product [Zymoseptoria tritici ST99CH_3D7]|uniref:Uncharacterized protein n=1 Tax=Zymoseptoria tritici (strain ST99CH_3D7) TaxID=1276538 RepID=A0A1X7RXC2_ZYMT9|nr:unnamed protein product [Zymoseptoria tritici ST99CH_3D7]